MSPIVIKALRPSIVTPPLQHGDRLTRAEFERRFELTPGLKKAELLNGNVYMPPPAVSHRYHGEPHASLLVVLGNYWAVTAGVHAGDNSSLRLDLENEPQPDVYLMIDPARGGQAKVDDEGYVIGAPELVGEIAASSASYDLHVKMDVYRRGGVREYIVWRTYEEEMDYFVLREGQFVKLAADDFGIWRSECFPGLWINGKALIAGDVAGALKVLKEGLASEPYRVFAVRLSSK